MPRPRLDEHETSEQTLDLFSHDSTHVHLVIEAEKQSTIAREKAMEILQKYSNQMAETETRDDTYPGQYSASPYINCRNQYVNDNDNENDAADDDGQKSNDGSQLQQRHGIFDHDFDELTEEDLEQIARCLLPLCPKALRKNKAKQVSGRFEFKRIITGAVSVVKSHQKLDIMSPEDLSVMKEREGAPKNGKQRDFSPKKGKRGGLRRRFSFSSRSKAGKDVDSGIYTDDALFHGDGGQEEKQMPPTKKGLNKKAKAGDLPPKPSPRPKPKRALSESVGAPSSRATASDADHEEVISVESDLSDLSETSISEKARERGPIVLTEAMLQTAVIPDMICLKKKVKLTKLEVLRRKLSFSKGKI